MLQPGIYVIAGGGIKITGGGSVSSVQGGAGAPAPVMFFNTDNPVSKTGQGDLTLNSSGDLLLNALDSGPYKGILVWNDGKGSNPTAGISLGGQANLNVSGTIYSPKGLVKLEGGGGIAGSTNVASVQIISWQFDVGGNFTLDMPYDPFAAVPVPREGPRPLRSRARRMGPSSGTNWRLSGARHRDEDRRMAKRIAAVVLWFVSVWMMYGLVDYAIGLPDAGGVVIAALAAFLVGVDPTKRIWVASAA